MIGNNEISNTICKENSYCITISDWVIYLFLWFSVFIPGHLLDFQLEKIYAIIVFIISIMLLSISRIPMQIFFINTYVLILIFALLTCLYMISYSYSILILGCPTGLRDYIELLRYPIYLVFILYINTYFSSKFDSVFEKVIKVSLYFCLLVGIVYMLNISFLSKIFKELIYANTKTFILYDGSIRLAAPFENPNFLAYYLVMILIYWLFFSKCMSSMKTSFYTFLTLLIIFLTGSRTGMVAGGAILLYWIILNILFPQDEIHRFKNLILTSLLLLLLYIAGSIAIEQVFRIHVIKEAFQGNGIWTEQSLNIRIKQFIDLWISYVNTSPLIGWGSIKYNLSTIVDNQYLLWIIRHGFLGFSIIIAFSIYLVIRFLSYCRFSRRYYFGVTAFFTSIAIFSLTGTFLDNFRLFFLTIFFIAFMENNLISENANIYQ